MKRKNSKTPKIYIVSLLLIALISMLCVIVYAEEGSGATAYINQSSAWSGVGCYLNIKDNNTNKWSAGIYDRNYKDNITVSSGISVGDDLYIDAYTRYQGGKLWVYEDDVAVRMVDAGQNQEHIYLNWTIRTQNTKFACSASNGALNGEELSVTIYATGDSQPPVCSMAQRYVKVNQSAVINYEDNVGVSGIYISKSSTVPQANANGWEAINPPKKAGVKYYTPQSEGVFYIWAKDAVNHVSSMISFEAIVEPVVPRPQDVAVREGKTATFIGVPSEGTAPYSYQWYKTTSNSNAGGTAIAGANSSTLNITAHEADNNTYYYVAVSNRDGFSTGKSEPAKLTVYYPHELQDISDITVKKGSPKTLTAVISKEGNTKNYRYQWYKAATNLSQGTRINQATNSQLIINPASNIHEEWYYCEVSNYDPNGNLLYTVSTNRAKVVADVISPVITLESITPDGVEYINQNAVTTFKFTVTEEGEGYVENNSNFTSSDVLVLVDDVQLSIVPTLTYNGKVGNQYNYTCTLTGVTGNGILKLKIPAGSIKDNFGNLNDETIFNPDITVDNTVLAIEFDKVDNELQSVYLNKDDEITIRMYINDSHGMNINEFTADDVVVKAGGVSTGSNITKVLNYDMADGNKFYYKLRLKNIEGNGPLTLTIPAGMVKDAANNANAEANLNITYENTQVIIDNTPPIINEVIKEFNSYGSGVLYPSSLALWRDGWANKDIYVTIDAEDTTGIDYYAYSMDGEEYTKLPENKKLFSDEYEGYAYFRVYDKAGNYQSVEQKETIKIDKTKPNILQVGVYELKEGGAKYVFNEAIPSNKTLYVKPIMPEDTGTVKSGVVETEVGDDINNTLLINGTRYGTYCTLKRYSNFSKTTLLNTWDFAYNTPAVALTENGYYEVYAYTVDKAGNTITNIVNDSVDAPYRIYIQKRTDNVISVSNILDIGSGVKKLSINVYRGGTSDVQRDGDGVVIPSSAERAVEPIIVDNPNKDFSTSVRLGRGNFYVECVLEDYVGWKTVYYKVITNNI